MPYVLSLDQGTTSSRAIVFDHAGRIVSLAQREFGQHFPKSGWVEHDAQEIWSTQLATALEAISRAGVKAGDLAAIGIANQRETTVLWERETGKPVARAIVWQDRRTAGICEQLKRNGHAGAIQEKTGLVVDAYFSGTKLKWLLDHTEGARERAGKDELAFGTVDSWLIWNLTGGKVHATDASNASRTMLYNIHSGEWDRRLLELLDIPQSVLPEVRGSSEVVAETAIEEFGTPIPIAGIAGDQQAALFGQVCTQPGMVKCTYGTGCFILMNTGAEVKASQNRLLSTVAWKIGAKSGYALEGSVFIGGAVVQWLRDGLGLIRSSSEIEALASRVDGSDGVYLVPAFTGLGAPYWDPYARGIVAGLTRNTSAAHLARAALEAIAYQVADVVHAMEADAGLGLKEIRVDGGASLNNLLMQFQADLLGVPVIRSKVAETTALGAACLAGLATGFWKGLEEIASQWAEDRKFEPRLSADERKALMDNWRRAVERAQGWAAPH